MHRRRWRTISYLIEKFKGIYRIKAPIDINTNDFPRKINGQYEDIDLYIDCQFGNKVFYQGNSTLLAYIPSIGRGRNIIQKIQETNPSIIYNIEETDEEILFEFKYVNSDKIIPLLKPRTNGANISPFSSKNLPRNNEYRIPDEALDEYKEIIQNIPQNKLLGINVIQNSFIKSLASKKHPLSEIKADMRLKGLRGKEYIHSIGKWDKYIKYLKENLYGNN